MDKAGKLTLRQILEQKVKGFSLGQVPYPPDNTGRRHRGDPKYRMSYKINEKEIRFVIDGVDLSYFYYPPDDNSTSPVGLSGRGRNSQQQPLFNSLSEDWRIYIDSYLDYFTADQIEGIEVMYNPRYNNSYINKYLSVTEQSSSFVGEKYAYIEITTRSGQGPFAKQTPGSYIYKPLPFSSAKPFRGPKYTSKNSSDAITDLRSTIQWAPNIITDDAGKANTSFYSADTPGSYTLTIEGIDLNGEPGYRQQQIEIKPK